MDSITRDAFVAREDGRYDDALRILERLFDQMDAGEVELAGNHFITMFEWSLLVGRYLPAHQALARTRDEQMRRLFQDEHHFGDVGEGLPRSRFNVIVEMNEILNDTRSTYDVFVHVASSCPAVARAEAHLALPAIVALGDFILAEAYVGDPLTQLPI